MDPAAMSFSSWRRNDPAEAHWDDPDPEAGTSVWCFRSANGFDDCALNERERDALHAVYAAMGPYTVEHQFIPD